MMPLQHEQNIETWTKQCSDTEIMQCVENNILKLKVQTYFFQL